MENRDRKAVEATRDVTGDAFGATQDATGDATGPATASPDISTLPPGLRIGPYRIVRELGHGGMGAVYLATRADEAYEKQVAIKLIRGAGGSAPEVIERFKRERQILARLEHPNIARLLDGGTTDDGLPYFVMEYIEGKPINRYCDEKSLSTVERLKLSLAVCSAVAYAHRNLIVHRDIKPGNILVTAEGVPRLLDFGIAKLIDPGAAAEVIQATAVAFTPWYASPEQVRGEPLATATDVYSLGVLVYELLTGHGPYRLKSLHPLEVLKAIAEQEAEAPSAAVNRALDLTLDGESHATVTPAQVSRTREGSPERLRHRLRGDLDMILMMALRKEPARRYPSVEAFAEDLGRYLEGRPIGARKGSLAYSAGKFVRRNRWGVAVAAAVVALLAASAANIVVQSRRVARERDRAEKVSRFMVELFSVSDPSEARGNTVTAREVLDKGVEKIGSELKDQPEVRADLLDSMGRVYDRLGLYEKAAPLLQDSVAIRRRFARDEPQALALTLNELGNVLMDKGDPAGAESVYREALDLRRRLLGNESREVGESINNLASVLEGQGHYDEAEALFSEALAIKRRVRGADDPAVATTLANLAIVRYKKGDRAGAQERFREVLAIQRKVLGEDHPEVANTLQNLGVLLDETGDYAGAEKMCREALALQRKVLGTEHPDIATTLVNLANTLTHGGRAQDAEPVYREALAMNRKFFGEDSNDVAATLVGLADVESQRGDLAAAETLLRQSVAIRDKKLGPDHPDVAESLTALSEVLRKRRKLGEAEAVARRGLGIREAKLPTDHPTIPDSLLALGRVLIDARRFADAEAPLLRAAERLEAQKGPSAGGGPSAPRRQVLEALAQLYERWGKAETAAQYRTRLAAAGRS